jgi:hypothetical protein
LRLYSDLVQTGQAGVVPGKLGAPKTRAREAVEPLTFDVFATSSRQLPLSNLPERNPVLYCPGAGVGGTTGDAGRAALSGLGGVDKTQTAVEYAHRYSKEYDYIFWVSAVSREGLHSGYVTIGGLLKLAEAGAQDETLAVGGVQRWLGSHERWLLILDRQVILFPKYPNELLLDLSLGHLHVGSDSFLNG